MSRCHEWNTACCFPPGVLLICDKEVVLAVAVWQGQSQAGWCHVCSLKQNRYKRLYYVVGRGIQMANRGRGSGRMKYLLSISEQTVLHYGLGKFFKNKNKIRSFNKIQEGQPLLNSPAPPPPIFFFFLLRITR